MKTPTDYLIEFDNFLKKHTKEDFYILENYKKLAEMYKNLVDSNVKLIWEKHKETLLMYINNVPICWKWSAVNTSTAFWYIIEEFINQQMLDCFSWNKGLTQRSAYDMIFKNHQDKSLLAINMKVEKNWSSNNWIVWWKSLQDFYLLNEDIPKLYLIVKSKYSINEEKSEVNIIWYESFYLESFLINYNFKTDHRSWKKEYEESSSRIQAPTKKEMSNYWIHTINNYKENFDFINNLYQKWIKK